MDEVKAANKTNKKNKIPAKVPIPIEANTLGKVINIKEGPLPRLAASPPLKANTAGMIIKPAKMAINVSKISTCDVLFSISTSFFIYDPNVIKMPIAMDKE